MKKLTIFLADLRHNFQGYMSSDAMPLGVGYMKAVMDKQLIGHYIKIFAYPDKLEEAIKQNVPDLLLLTNYTWNEALSLHFAKKGKDANSNCLVVMGGPNIPVENERRIDFLKQYPQVDLYALGEGDFFAAELVQAFIEANYDKERLFQQEIHSSVYLKEGQYAVTGILPRTKNIDDIPSPWLTGVLDEFFDGTMVPLFETNRGCPFSCTFCVQGTKWYNKVNNFSLPRIEAEIKYIAKKISEDFPQQKMLRIADPNFGMYSRDIEIASYIGEAQRMYQYPLIIDATTGKNKADNIIKTMEQVNGALVLYQAVQSLDDEVLENIQRSNIKIDAYKDLQVHIKGRGLKSSSDLILGLPGESLEKHLQSLEKIINSGTDKLNNFQAMLLKGSDLDTQACRQKYQFETMYRLLPKAYGLYFNELVLDTEEIIVGSKDLSFEDYLSARKYHLIINIFWNFTRFDGLLKIVERKGITPWQWIDAIMRVFNESSSPLIISFIQETKNELFESEEDLRQFYSQADNLERLNSGEIGDNLIYKYRTLGLFYYWEDIVDIAVQATINLVPFEEVSSILMEYGKLLKLNFVFGKTEADIFEDKQETFVFDILLWIQEDFDTSCLRAFQLEEEISLSFSLSKENKVHLKDALKIWSFDPKSFSMFIRRIHHDWLKKEIKIAQKELL
jgi:radical SAM superfamily enzyme YgiQ (UPF0313 family)